MYAWNKEEMQKGMTYPSKAFWNQLLVLTHPPMPFFVPDQDLPHFLTYLRSYVLRL